MKKEPDSLILLVHILVIVVITSFKFQFEYLRRMHSSAFPISSPSFTFLKIFLIEIYFNFVSSNNNVLVVN